MTFFRNLGAALERMSDRMQGQDVERRHLVGSRFGAAYAALAKASASQGFSSIGMGR
ncbi:MAG: hypothetical protein L0J57_06325 [Brachybacterium sp.]|nr:hypothetical protein [Brachybacterium sp.]